MIDIALAASAYLGLRYLPWPELGWKAGVIPTWPAPEGGQLIGVHDPDTILDTVTRLMVEATAEPNTGLLLSGGMDSAVLAALMPRGARAYTIRFDAPGAIDESAAAAICAAQCGLQHHIVTVTWADYQRHMDGLMQHKGSPLHPVEVGLYLAACQAAADGVQTLVLGNGADSTFGGLDKLLSRDWTPAEFVARYTFLDPQRALRDPADLWPAFAPYAHGDHFDTADFLKTVHGQGVIQAFNNAIGAGGCRTAEPYERLCLDRPLDLARIRQGESKYLLRAVFAQLHPTLTLPGKIAFARPMDAWLADWPGPRRPEFRPDLDVATLTGEQRWLVYGLEQFLNLLD
jgi:hypothetical protein